MEEQPGLQSNAEQSNASGIEEILVTPFITAPRIFPHSWSPDSTLLAYWTFTAAEVKEDFKLPPGALHFLNMATGQICTFPYPVRYSYFGDRIFWFATSEIFLVTDDHQVLAGNPCANDFTDLTHLLPAAVDIVAANADRTQYLLSNKAEPVGWSPDGQILIIRGIGDDGEALFMAQTSLIQP